MSEPPVSPLVDAVTARRSYSKVTDDAPSHDEIVRLVEAAATVADHSALAPWRIIEIRGEARERVGAAIAASSGLTGDAAAKLAQKPLRAPLLLAVVASRRDSIKVPHWEQDVSAAGVAHLLSLLLDSAGWGVMWRTGTWTRTPDVAAAHGLRGGEVLLGWLYVGGIPDGERRRRVTSIDAESHLSVL